jgi:hypothetical protein
MRALSIIVHNEGDPVGDPVGRPYRRCRSTMAMGTSTPIIVRVANTFHGAILVIAPWSFRSLSTADTPAAPAMQNSVVPARIGVCFFLRGIHPVRISVHPARIINNHIFTCNVPLRLLH